MKIRLSHVLSLLLLCTALLTAGLSFAGNSGYRVGPADVLSVTIFAGGEEQVAVDLTVSGRGTVNFPFVGAVEVSGLTTSQIEGKIVRPLKRDYFVDPQVHVRILEYHSLHFFISGAVAKPGKYEMQSATTIMDLIAKAEGVTQDSGAIAYVMRNGKSFKDKPSSAAEADKNEPVKVNLIKLLDEGDMSHNLDLSSGDSVYIPFSKGLNQSEQKVYISGEVKKPDLYQYQPGMTALSLCIMAGGFDQYAAPNRTTIVRMKDGKQQVIKINLDDVVKGQVDDIPLKAGDRIHVPESWL